MLAIFDFYVELLVLEKFIIIHDNLFIEKFLWLIFISKLEPKIRLK